MSSPERAQQSPASELTQRAATFHGLSDSTAGGLLSARQAPHSYRCFGSPHECGRHSTRGRAPAAGHRIISACHKHWMPEERLLGGEFLFIAAETLSRFLVESRA